MARTSRLHGGGCLGRGPVGELAEILLGLVDQGLIEVHRYARWTDEQGRDGLDPGDLVPRRDLPELLATPATWEYPDDPHWIGSVTLVGTEAARKLASLSPEELSVREHF